MLEINYHSKTLCNRTPTLQVIWLKKLFPEQANTGVEVNGKFVYRGYYHSLLFQIKYSPVIGAL